jgi:hypothetical protein
LRISPTLSLSTDWLRVVVVAPPGSVKREVERLGGGSGSARPLDARNALRAGTAPAADGAAGLSEELARLGELHQQGQLSDDEFAAAKSKLLGA